MPEKQNKPKRQVFEYIIILIAFILILITYLIYDGYAAYIFPPIGQRNAEMLGQLGDYFGGFLNPIFGLISVLLITISMKNQREESRRNYMILRQQLVQDKFERERLQLSENLSRELELLQLTIDQTFPTIVIKYKDYSDTTKAFSFVSIASLDDLNIRTHESLEITVNKLFREFDFKKQDEVHPNFYLFWFNGSEAIKKLKTIQTILIDHIAVCDVKSTNTYWFNKFNDFLRVCESAGIIDQNEYQSFLKPVQSARNIFELNSR